MEKFLQCMKEHDGVHLHCHQQTKVNGSPASNNVCHFLHALS